MTRNSRSIARNFNAAMEQTGRAIRPKSQSPWVYNILNFVSVKYKTPRR